MAGDKRRGRRGGWGGEREVRSGGEALERPPACHGGDGACCVLARARRTRGRTDRRTGSAGLEASGARTRHGMESSSLLLGEQGQVMSRSQNGLLLAWGSAASADPADVR